MEVDRSEVLQLLERLRYWQEYSRKADNHIEALAAQVENLHSEINHLRIELEGTKSGNV